MFSHVNSYSALTFEHCSLPFESETVFCFKSAAQFLKFERKKFLKVLARRTRVRGVELTPANNFRPKNLAKSLKQTTRFVKLFLPPKLFDKSINFESHCVIRTATNGEKQIERVPRTPGVPRTFACKCDKERGLLQGRSLVVLAWHHDKQCKHWP